MKHHSITGMRLRSTRPAITAALMAAGLLSNAAYGQIQSAGTLFVDVDATKLAEGPLKTIKNNGTLSGLFEATGAATTVPTVATEGGTKGIRFDGTDFLHLVSAAGGPVAGVPDGLVGENATTSIEVWALNPQVAGEETLVSWGHRGGGPDGSNMSFNYGSDGRWGAVGHWGNPDLGWNNAGGSPAAGKWHHLVYSFDGTTSRVYADGVLANFEFLGAGIINTHPDTSINIGTQLEADGTTPTGGLRFSGTIARVRIHDGVLTPEQVSSNYNKEKADFIDPQPPAPTAPERLAKSPIHRYSFGDAAKADASGTTFKDSIGTADGKVLGAGAEFTGSRLRLTAGGASADAAYGDLPNGLLSSNGAAKGGTGEFSFETWFRHTGSHTWSRVMDFGSTTVDGAGGEVDGPGGGGNGLDYLCLSAQIGGNVNQRRLELRDEDPGGGGVFTADTSTATFNIDTHLLITWKESTGRITLFENGRELGGVTTTSKLSDINDVNVWLGRSNWTADQNTQGEYDEVRIYNTALTPGQAVGNFLAGPDLINDKDTAVVIAKDPETKSVPETLPVTFRVDARGSSPVTFQWLRNGAPIDGATGPTYTIGNVSAADNGVKFSVEVANSVAGKPVKVTSSPATLTVISDTVTLKHRYSFSETSGTAVKDSVGGANGTAFGAGTQFQNGQIALDGTGDGYVDLPNGIITALGNNGTIEMWYTWDGGPVWSRAFDFGISTDGEDGQNGGIDYLFYTPRNGDGWPMFIANFPDAGDTTTLHHPGSSIPGVEEHVVISYSSTGGNARLYSNGKLVASGPAPKALSAMNGRDINVWLGRSQYNDPFFPGKFNEFRIYQGAMTPEQVAASFTAGADNLPATPSAAPKLTVQHTGGNVVVSWPADATGFQLESSTALGANANWSTVSTAPTTAGGQSTVSLPISGDTTRFLRLKK
jgi:hypothetical protein